MATIRKEKPQVVRVSKRLAKEFAEMDNPPGGRPLSERRLAVYQRVIAAGDFHTCVWAKALCLETNATYRINGQHTSILLSGLDTIPEFWVTLESFSCDTLEDVAKLYADFDSKIASRNASDIYMSFAGTVPELRAVSRRTIGHAVAGIAYAYWFEDVFSQQPAQRAELLLEHSDFVLWLDNTININRHHSLDRAPVIAAMFNSRKKSQAAADTFWLSVRDATGVSPTTPDRKLNRFLLTTGISMGRGGSKPESRTCGRREMYVRCTHAWNSWRSGEQTDLKYYPTAKIPAMR